jgi:hypothetical protein
MLYIQTRCENNIKICTIGLLQKNMNKVGRMAEEPLRQETLYRTEMEKLFNAE